MGKKNKLSTIIKFELICLAVVSIIVFGLVRWSEERMSAAQAGSKQGSQPAGMPEGGGGITDIPMPAKEGDPADTPVKSVTPEPVAEPATGTISPVSEPTAAEAPTPRPMATGTPAPEPTAVITKTPEEPTAVPGEDGAFPEGMDKDFIQSLKEPQPGEILEAAGAVSTTYYMQTDPRWGSLIYGGEDTIAKYACGPTSMAIVVSSLTNIGIDPVQMSEWACGQGYWYPESGSLHSIINGTAKAFGLISEGVGNDSETAQKVIDNLKEGGMAVALMGKGHFTKSGHFIVLRGIAEDGKILVADCNSRDNTMQEWDMETLMAEAKYASDGGPFWIIRKPNTME